ncbi:transcription termination factor Rho [Smaragdicoccus niigatensis]|uniref:transcription termination factor Rho n=1 Tax=Smaragdicoccus niigatensis TaxID=359359 RepID=UPI0007673403|nr:transcription termination factor Rho [Smaragdicoccus niigatensis]
MTDTDLVATSASETISGLPVPQLRSLAGQLGIKGTSAMRKDALIAAISERQAGSAPRKPSHDTPAPATAPAAEAVTEAAPPVQPPAPPAEVTGDGEDREDGAPRRQRQRRGASRQAGSPESQPASDDAPASEAAGEKPADQPKSEDSAPSDKPAEGGERPRRERGPRDENRAEGGNREGGQQREGQQRDGGNRERGEGGNREGGNREGGQQREGQQRDGGNRERGEGNRNQGGQGGQRNQGGGQNQGGQGNQGNQGGQGNQSGPGDDDDDRGGRRGRRFRERRRGNRGEGGQNTEPEIREDDVLQPVAGILDVLDNYAFVRTSGYLPGPNDVYVSMNMVRKSGLRRGDAVTGAVRAARDGEQSNQRQKFDPLVRLDTINGGDSEAAKRRPEFQKLTPLYPNERLRLETTQAKLTTRIIDLIMPIGKGQRALIVSPPKAGKTTIMQDIANAIATNNPECYLMVVLVDERPEEVTDMQRSVKGEVISSTFDRPPSDHTAVAELAIERAKRLVEMGKDVIVLLDSITRLGRAYNNSSPASGRILSGGVDSTALYPPKRFLGAARNIENGGSLTIIATAMVETGSTGDTVIFEEFKGTGNAELKLDRKIAERRVFPAVDVNPSGTRKDELLLSPEEFGIVHKLRRVLSGLDSHQAIDLLVDRLRKTKTNYEFLMTVSKNAPGADE